MATKTSCEALVGEAEAKGRDLVIERRRPHMRVFTQPLAQVGHERLERVWLAPPVNGACRQSECRSGDCAPSPSSGGDGGLFLASTTHVTIGQCYLCDGNLTVAMTCVLDALRVGVVVPIQSSAGTTDDDAGQVRHVDAHRERGHPVEEFPRFKLKHGGHTVSTAAFERPYLREPPTLRSPLGAGLSALKARAHVSIASNELPGRPYGPLTSGSRA